MNQKELFISVILPILLVLGSLLLAQYIQPWAVGMGIPHWSLLIILMLLVCAIGLFLGSAMYLRRIGEEKKENEKVLEQLKSRKQEYQELGDEYKFKLVAAHIPLGLAKYIGRAEFTIQLAGEPNGLKDFLLNHCKPDSIQAIRTACQKVAEALQFALELAYHSCYIVDPSKEVFRVAVLLPEEVTDPDPNNPGDTGKVALFIQGASDINSESFRERRYFLPGSSYAGHAWEQQRVQIGQAGKSSDGTEDPRWQSMHENHIRSVRFCEIACIPIFDELAPTCAVGVISIDVRQAGSLQLAIATPRLLEDAVRLAGIMVVAAVRKHSC